MCGIVGWITKETKKGELDRSRFLKQGLIIDTLRGDDSTGAYGVFHDPGAENVMPYWFKMLGPGSAFVDAKEYWENFADVSPYRCVVGHNRAATMGGVDVDNAHPFIDGPITLVHNGTLNSTYHLPAGSMYDLGCSVDSHAIAKNLAQYDVEEVVSKLNGAFALVWHDARDDSVNIVRNDKRPLHFGMGWGSDTLYFMSEGEMLSLLDTRIKLGIKQIYFPSEGQYLKWLPDTPLDRPITKEIDLYEDYWSGQGFGYRGTRSGYDSYGAYGAWEDDDDAEWESRFPKAGAHNEKEDWILVGGRKKEVPMILQEAMLQYDVVTEDRWEFTPTAYGLNSQDADRMYVAGELYPLGGKGIIYSISPNTANQTGTGKKWTVRVIGVKISAEGEPWFICRLVSTFVNPHIIAEPRDDSPGWDDEVPYEHTSTPPRGMVMGPEGMYIRKSEWYAHVVDGCVMCNKTISIMDAEDLIWVSEGAICPNCDDRLYEPPHSRGTYNEIEGEIV